MRIISFVLLYLFFTTSSIFAQKFKFEKNYDGWKAKNGTISLTSDHYKEGQKSLCWKTKGTSRLEINTINYNATSSLCANMYIYSEKRTNDTLIVDFMRKGTVLKTGNYLFNYKGWHEFKRWYRFFSNSDDASIDKVVFTLRPQNNEIRSIYFDDVNLIEHINSKKDITGSHWILDSSVLLNSNENLGMYYHLKEDSYCFEVASYNKDILLTVPNTQELNALNRLREQFKPINKYDSIAYNNAVKFVDDQKITYLKNGLVKGGKIIPSNASDISINTFIAKSSESPIYNLVALAGGVNKGIKGAIKYFNTLFDYVIDQGLGEGAPIHGYSNRYDELRLITRNWSSILAGCSDNERYDEALKALKWYCYYGAIYSPEEKKDITVSSDVYYLTLKSVLTAIVSERDDASAVRDLKAYKRYLERGVRYTPGREDMLKPDGTGFHHGVHYINYMRAYTTITQAFSWLSHTPFRVSIDAYEHLRKAVITIYTMSTKSENDVNMYALSLCGRSPFSKNHCVSYSKSLFEILIEVGRDCMHVNSEPIAEGAYNYFFNASKYKCRSSSYDGFHAYNYAPVGIYRYNNWVITMRAPTSAFWGSEIYVKTNRFGRYQSNGTLEVLYSGNDLSSTGYPTTQGSGGWDWNSPQGGTTVRYTDWGKMMPHGDVNTRHDQFSNSDFSGGLALGHDGIYACDFIQRDSWTKDGTSNYPGTETDLRFKKSYYCFDGIVIALGSNIGNDGNYPFDMKTTTNLFQEIVSDSDDASFYVDGEKKQFGFIKTIQPTEKSSFWMITPKHTGYFVPKGNDECYIFYNKQTTPYFTGNDYESPKTTLTAVKSYFVHGYNTHNKTYSYIMKPNATAKEMQLLGEKINNGKLYKIEQQDSLAHAIHYFPNDTWSYSFFDEVENVKYGNVKSVTGSLLLMERKNMGSDNINLSVCVPNLYPKYDLSEPLFRITFNASKRTIVFRGKYRLITASDQMKVRYNNNETIIDISFKDGLPVIFQLEKY